jgi:hypothetical protein
MSYQGPTSARLAAPRSGVVDKARVTVNSRSGVQTLVLPSGAKRAWVYFHFASRPAKGQKIHLVFYRNGAKWYDTGSKPNAAVVESYLPIHANIRHLQWRVVLMVGTKNVRQLVFHVR